MVWLLVRRVQSWNFDQRCRHLRVTSRSADWCAEGWEGRCKEGDNSSKCQVQRLLPVTSLWVIYEFKIPMLWCSTCYLAFSIVWCVLWHLLDNHRPWFVWRAVFVPVSYHIVIFLPYVSCYVSIKNVMYDDILSTRVLLLTVLFSTS